MHSYLPTSSFIDVRPHSTKVSVFHITSLNQHSCSVWNQQRLSTQTLQEVSIVGCCASEISSLILHQLQNSRILCNIVLWSRDKNFKTVPPRSMQLHNDANTVGNLVRCPLTQKSDEVAAEGCICSAKGLTSFPYPLVSFPVILVLLSRLNLNQFALSCTTVSTKLLMRCLITLSVQDAADTKFPHRLA